MIFISLTFTDENHLIYMLNCFTCNAISFSILFFFFAVNQYLINCPRAPAVKEFRYTYDKLEKKGYDDRISYLSKYLQIFIGEKYTNKISYF